MKIYPVPQKNKIRSIFRFVSILLICVFLVPVNYSMALEKNNEKPKSVTKEEVIYGKLTATGKPSELYVVNAFNLPEKTEIEDYGNYSSVRNLSNLNPLSYSDKKISISAAKGRFYYQGTMKKKELPWNIDIHYYLNGEEKHPEELTGAKGKIRLTIETSQGKIPDNAFYEKYMLQISVTLDTEFCTNIKAKGATIVNAGTNKMINFTVMPGKSSKLELTADVTDFRMTGISIAGVPFSMGEDMIDMDQINQMTEGLEFLTEGISRLNNGASQLNTGVRLFSDGTAQLSKGYAAFHRGMEQMHDGANDLHNGALQLKNGSSEYQNGFNQLAAGGNELVDGSSQINNALQDLMANAPDISTEDIQFILHSLKKLHAALEHILPSLEDFLEQTPFQEVTVEERSSALAELEVQQEKGNISENTIEVFKKLLNDYTIAQYTNELINGDNGIKYILNQFIKILDRFNSQVEIPENFDPNIIKQFATQYSLFHQGLCQYVDGVNQLNQNYSKIHNGIDGLNYGINMLSSGLQEASGGSLAIFGGIKEISNGAKELSNGMNQLTDGITTLNSNTSQLPAQVRNSIDEMISRYKNTDFIPTSFTSRQNGKVDTVQFVLTTDPIDAPEKTPVEKEKKDSTSLLDKFLNLFR